MFSILPSPTFQHRFTGWYDMQHIYRAFLISSDHHIVDRVEIEFDGDDTAKERAKRLVDGHDVELWDGTRKIAKFTNKN